MSCTFCKKNDFQLATHSMCDCCLVHLECCEATPENRLATSTKRVIPEDDDEVEMRECDICLEEYHQNDLEEHRGTCMARFVLRCAVCNEDYVSKEGLWNHLVDHDIPVENKELNYKEIRVTYNLHQCVLCNDQRGYPESSYWNHVHEDHDGFFLRCLECGDNFRSEKLQIDHELNHCKKRKTAKKKDMDSGGYVQIVLPFVKQRTLQNKNIVPKKQPRKKQPPNFPRSKCILCNRLFMKVSYYNYHMLTYHSDPQYQCPRCSKKFHLKDTLERHLKQCKTETETELSVNSGDDSSGLTLENDVSDVASTAEKDNSQSCNGASEKESDQISSPSDEVSVKPSHVNCPHCSEQYSEEELIDHIDSVHKSITCDICGDSLLGQTKLDYHKIEFHTEAPYKCQECAELFQDMTSYQQHLNTHQNEGKFSCDLCHQKFENSDLLDCHKKQTRCVSTAQTDESQEDAKCPHCHEHCYQAKYVQTHIEYFHQPMKCDMCDGTFFGRNNLLNHKYATHKMPKHQCSYCPREFRNKNIFQRHISMHERATNCTCKHCGRMFTTIEDLRSHVDCSEQCKDELIDELQSSTDSGNNSARASPLAGSTEQAVKDTYQCPHCPRKFHANKIYMKHLRFHKRSEAFFCRTCGDECKSLDDLVVHTQNGHGEKKYKRKNDSSVQPEDGDNIVQEGPGELKQHLCDNILDE